MAKTRAAGKRGYKSGAAGGGENKSDSSVLVRVPNSLLTNAFGDPFMLQNYRYDPELVGQLRDDGDDDDGDDDDERLVPLIHANVAYAVEAFLRSRNAQGRNLTVKSQGDSDHVWDIGAVLKDHRNDDELILARGDYRWLLQKAEELAHEAFPVDARMFIDCLKIAKGNEDKGDGAQGSESKED